CYDHVKAFIFSKYGCVDYEIKRLDYEFIDQFAFWLKSIRGCNQNSTTKYIANFRKIVNGCLKSGWLDKDPFFGFKMIKKEINPQFLNEYELQIMKTKSFASERLNQVRDIFLFC